MAKELVRVLPDGESWTGTFAEFTEDLDDAGTCGFIGASDGFEWAEPKERMRVQARAVCTVDGKLTWIGRNSGRQILLVVAA